MEKTSPNEELSKGIILALQEKELIYSKDVSVIYGALMSGKSKPSDWKKWASANNPENTHNDKTDSD
jgi:hypothetical protein